MSRRPHRRGRRQGTGAAVMLAMAMALALAGCGQPSGADAQVASANGSGGAKSAKSAATKKADAEKAGLDFARCMREHGVDVPDPGSGAGGFLMVGPVDGSDSGSGSVTATASASAALPDSDSDSDPDSDSGGPEAGPAMPEGFGEADKACRHFLEGLIQDGGPPMDAEAQDNALKFAKCMREHGVDMPDPNFSGGGGGFSVSIGAGGIDPGSQTFKDAQKACGSLFGPGGGAPGQIVTSAGVKP